MVFESLSHYHIIISKTSEAKSWFITILTLAKAKLKVRLRLIYSTGVTHDDCHMTIAKCLYHSPLIVTFFLYHLIIYFHVDKNQKQ
jgi:hypothetical protein